MVDFGNDQAEGLRRLLAGPRPRVLSLLSVLPEADKSATLINLGASLAATGSRVLLLDAQPQAAGVSGRLRDAPRTSLAEVVRQQRPLGDALRRTGQGFHLAILASAAPVSTAQAGSLAAAFDTLARQNDLILVDAMLDERTGLPLAALAAGELVVQVSAAAADITAGYALIKRLSGALGRQTLGILVSAASQAQAERVFHNMASAASRYLGLDLQAVGSVPADEHIRRASRLGRSVVDMFPLAGASLAFRNLAGRWAQPGLPLGKCGGSGGLPASAYGRQ